MSSSRRGFFARLAAIAATPFAKKVADALPSDPENPAEVARLVAGDMAEHMGCEVDHDAFDDWADYCRQSTGPLVKMPARKAHDVGEVVYHDNGFAGEDPATGPLIGRVVRCKKTFDYDQPTYDSKRCRLTGIRHEVEIEVAGGFVEPDTRCPWPFKGEPCGYSGPMQGCDKSFASCTFLGNQERFGGSPSMFDEPRMRPWRQS